jgi:mRNA interferase MazF
MVNKKASYIPARGDIVWIDFSPQTGFEQSWRRPALVLTAKEYNCKTSRFIVCPITSQVKGYVFEYPIPAHSSVQGVILIDHIKNQDWTKRNIEFIEKLTSDEIEPICDIVDALLRIN